MQGPASVLLFVRHATAAGCLALSAAFTSLWTCQLRAEDAKSAPAAAPAVTTTAVGEEQSRSKQDKEKQSSDKPADAQKAEGEKKADAEKKSGDSPGDDKSKEKKPDDTAPIHRPAEPPKPADPNELKVRPDEHEKIAFSFRGQPWQAVLEWLADITHMSLDWQEVPAGYLDLTTRRKYELDEARDLINYMLLSKGFTLLRNGEVLVVVNLKNLDVSLVPRVSPNELDERGTFEFVRTFFNLDRLQVEPLVEEIKPLLGPYGKINALKTTNRIDMLDTAGNLRRIREIIGAEQNESGKSHQVKQFQLKYARADAVLSTLKHLLGIQDRGEVGGGGGGNQDLRQQLQQQQQMLQQMQQQQQGEKGKQPRQQNNEDKIFLAINPRENSIIALATPDKLATIEQAVSLLDVPSPNDSASANLQRISSYRLVTADPAPIMNILKEMGNLDPSTQLEVDNASHAIIVNGPLADHWTVQSLIKKIDGSARHIEVFKLQKLDAENVAGSIEFLMRGPSNDKNRPRYVFGDYRVPDQGKDAFQVEADTKNNRLLLRANDLELQEVRQLMIKLGEDPFAGTEGDNMRVIHSSPGKETEMLLDRLKRIWPSVSPHPLQLDVQPDDPSEKHGPVKDDGEKPSNKKKQEEAERGKAQPGKPVSPTATAVIPWHHSRFTATAVTEADSADTANDLTLTPVRGAGGASDQSKRADSGLDRALPSSIENGVGRRADNKSDADSPAPISIIQGPQGLIVSSRDAASVDQLMKLIDQLSPASSRYHAFTLHHVYAKDVAGLLETIFADDKGKRDNFSINYFFDPPPEDKPERNRLSKKQPLKFTADSVTNSILVQNADDDQLAEIKSLVDFYDRNEPPDSQSIRKTKIVTLKHAKAQAVADVLKDVYVDLLSPNDKTLRSNNPRQEQPRPYYSFYDMGSRSQSSENVPKFKSLLSIGVDSTSNSLVVSAPQYLLEDVLAMIDRLDVTTRAAEPVVRVISAGGALDDPLIKDALKAVADPDGKHTRSSSSQSRDQQRNRGNNNNNGRNGNNNGNNNSNGNNNNGQSNNR